MAQPRRIRMHPADNVAIIANDGGLAAGTRSTTLTGLTNYTTYQVTLNAMVAGSPVLTDTVSVMPTDLLLYLPLTIR